MSSIVSSLVKADGTFVAVLDINGEMKSVTITPSDRNYREVRDAYKIRDVNRLIELVSEPIPTSEQLCSTVASQVGECVVKDGEVFLNGEKLENSVTECIAKLWKDGDDYQPMVNFLNNLIKNPSYRSRRELYQFLEVCGLSITEDGCFLGYKTVRSDYKDKYTGTIDNSPGKSPTRMERRDVDDDCTHTCSKGYHVGALSYAGPGGWYNSEGDRVVIVKVNPEDVVSIPVDHSFQKLRTCYYTVLSDFNGELNKPLYSGKVGDDYKEEEKDDWDEDEELQVEDMLEGNEYTFSYTKKDGSMTYRQGIVEENFKNSDSILVELTFGEHSGEYRRFKKSGIGNVSE